MDKIMVSRGLDSSLDVRQLNMQQRNIGSEIFTLSLQLYRTQLDELRQDEDLDPSQRVEHARCLLNDFLQLSCPREVAFLRSLLTCAFVSEMTKADHRTFMIALHSCCNRHPRTY